MSECSLSGRGQGHVSNFYIVDLENFATASRRYTGDIHKSSVVGLFMTHLRQWRQTHFLTQRHRLPVDAHGEYIVSHRMDLKVVADFRKSANRLAVCTALRRELRVILSPV